VKESEKNYVIEGDPLCGKEKVARCWREKKGSTLSDAQWKGKQALSSRL